MAREGDEFSFSHSSVLFTKPEGNSVKFQIRPSGTKARLKPLIEHGGGSVTSKKDPDCIIILVEGDKFCPEGCIEARYIDDCVAQNQMLDIDKYRVNPKNIVAEGESGKPPSPSTSVISTTSSVKGRSAYITKDDDAILSYIARNPENYGGNKVWKKMEMMRVTTHPWQSMRDRFNKKLESRLPDYIRKFKEGVLEKYGFTSTSASSDEDKQDDTKEKENLEPVCQNSNTNNNQNEVEHMEVDSNDSSFDISLMEAADNQRHTRAADKEKENIVKTKKKRNHDPLDSEETVGKQNKPSGKTTLSGSKDLTDRSSGNENPIVTTGRAAQHTKGPQNTDNEVQSSRITRSKQALHPEQDTVVHVQSDVCEKEDIQESRSRESIRADSKSQGKSYSSQDAEAEDTDDASQSSRVTRKTRHAGDKRHKRNLRSTKTLESSSSSDEEQEVELTSPKIPRFDQIAIDKIINEKLHSESDKEGASNRRLILPVGEEEEEDTQITEVKGETKREPSTVHKFKILDSLPNSQDTVDQCEEALADDVQTMQSIMTEFGCSVKAAMYAICMNSGNIDATLQYLRTGQPPEGCFLWMKEDDEKLQSSNPEDVKKLIRKFGEVEVSARQNYLDS